MRTFEMFEFDPRATALLSQGSGNLNNRPSEGLKLHPVALVCGKRVEVR